MARGLLYLIPTPLGDEFNRSEFDPAKKRISETKVFVVEEIRTARRFIAQLGLKELIDQSTFYILNENEGKENLNVIIQHCLNGENVVLMSEAGCPAIADPGSDLVSLAQEKKVNVVPMVGPSSILLSLMASGFNGQGFTFHGYLPRKNPELQQFIKKMEKDSENSRYTQLFIEAPYRNQKLLEELVQTLKPETKLCISCDLTQAKEFVHTNTVKTWRSGKLPDLHKRPAVFLIQG